MTEDRGGASEGSTDSEQPGVAPDELVEELGNLSPDDIEITGPDEMDAPGARDDSPSIVNSDLVDDPEELARTIREATGESVEVVSEREQEKAQEN